MLTTDQIKEKYHIKLSDLAKIVSEAFDVPVENLKTKRRKRWDNVYPKYCYLWIAIKLFGYTNKKAAEFLNYEEHSLGCYGKEQWQHFLNNKDIYKKENEAHERAIDSLPEYVTKRAIKPLKRMEAYRLNHASYLT